MRASIFFYIVNILLLLNLMRPFVRTDNIVQEKVKKAINAVNEKFDKYDKKKKKLMLAGAAAVGVALVTTLLGGAYFIKERRTPKWDDPMVVADVFDVLLDTIDDGVIYAKKSYYAGKGISKSIPSKKVLEKYILKNIRHQRLDMTNEEKKEILSMIPYIQFNIRKLCYNFADMD
ncbi:early transcribed membrane protein [Plasmodium ovale]|uniref:Early transcribed membrane protein n=2 Tax=Plasmodium ovale TaxID=36330 RepID=A0A1A8WE72_PLAOA|nr:early transcribed membrane protein [Plasmodium ovale curtisi]SBS91224.1 early transcribed membrane protein [Plasmodium ovale curtisi]SCA48517.1 early transcribed membrane protein [Plasmodium ovale]